MKKAIAFMAVFVAVTFLPVLATIINIPADYPTIQQGINASVDGDTVLVQPGIYVENINFIGHNIVLGSLFLTIGDTSYISQTVIDGDSTGSSVVTFGNGEDSTTIIKGFTIRNGFSTQGGGIRCESSSPTIINNRIIHNITDGHGSEQGGGGIYCGYESNPTIKDNTITENETIGYDGGAGILCKDNSDPIIINNIVSGNELYSGGNSYGAGISCLNDSDPMIISNTIKENFSGAWSCGLGGGISCDSSNPIIGYNNISSNTAWGSSGGYGGGISCSDNSSPIIYNNIIEGNVAEGTPPWGYTIGGGIYIGRRSCNPIILSNTIIGNYARDYGGGIGVSYWGVPIPQSVINTIFWDNSASEWPQIYGDTVDIVVSFCDIQGGWSGEGNIDADPLFRDPGSGDFHLMSIACGDSANSPCIDAGDPAILDSLLDCSWGLGGLRSDMGAYGGGDSATVDIIDNDYFLPEEITLMQNYPNPFNSGTIIRFSIVRSMEVRLAVYDILGRKVRTLIDEYKQAGFHTANFDATGLSSGVYFCRLRVGEAIETRPMVLLR